MRGDFTFVYSLTQLITVPTQTPDVDSQSPSLLDLLQAWLIKSLLYTEYSASHMHTLIAGAVSGTASQTMDMDCSSFCHPNLENMYASHRMIHRC